MPGTRTRCAVGSVLLCRCQEVRQRRFDRDIGADQVDVHHRLECIHGEIGNRGEEVPCSTGTVCARVNKWYKQICNTNPVLTHLHDKINSPEIADTSLHGGLHAGLFPDVDASYAQHSAPCARACDVPRNAPGLVGIASDDAGVCSKHHQSPHHS